MTSPVGRSQRDEFSGLNSLILLVIVLVLGFNLQSVKPENQERVCRTARLVSRPSSYGFILLFLDTLNKPKVL